MSNELLVFKKRLDRLANVIDSLLGNASEDQVKPLATKLAALKLIVRNAETLNTGGHFEWIDSKIVRALKLGQFICLEHVNLCSSAILDRLNSVFETNGKLLLSEKGVSSAAGNQAECVRRHKEFRAFLTLDPRNGEISRAMRNRCIELNVDSHAYSMDDLKQLIYENGVHEIYCIDWILSIHLRQKLTEFNNFGVSHLTKFAFLVAENRRLGNNDVSALYASAMEVYVRSSHIDLLGFGLNYYQNKLIESIAEELKAEPVDRTEHFDFGNLIVHANGLSPLSLIKLQTEPFLAVIDCLKTGLDQEQTLRVLTSMKSVFSERKVSLNNDAAKYLLYILYELSSRGDIEMRKKYIRRALSKYSTEIAKNPKKMTKKIAVDVKVKGFGSPKSALESDGQISEYKTPSNALPVEIKEADSAKSSDVNVDELISKNEMLAGVVEAIEVKVESSLPWNRGIFPRVRDYTSENSLSSRDQLRTSCVLLVHLMLDGLETSNVTKLSQIDALTYSKAVNDRQISNSLDIDLVTSLHPFLDGIKEYVISKINASTALTYEQYVELSVALLWADRFIDVARSRLFASKVLSETIIDKLTLHFNWMGKHLLNLVDAIEEKGTTDSANFGKHRKSIALFIERNFHPLCELRKRYVKAMTSFVPFYDENQVHLHDGEHLHSQETNLIAKLGHFERDELIKRFRVTMSEESSIYRKVLFNLITNDSLVWLNEFKSEEVTNEAVLHVLRGLTPIEYEQISDISELNAEVEKFQSFCESARENVPTSTLSAFKLLISTLPVLEYFALRSMNSIQAGNSSDFLFNNEFFMKIRSTSIEDLKLLKIVSNGNMKQCDEFWRLVQQATQSDFAEFLAAVPAAFYRNHSTFMRQIVAQLRSLAMRSLALNQGICFTALDDEMGTKVAEMQSLNGPLLTTATLSSLCDQNGGLKASGLGDIEIQRQTLSSLSQAIWNNVETIQSHFDFETTNGQASIAFARKLLAEINLIRSEKIVATENAQFLEHFESLISSLGSVTAKVSEKKDFYHSSVITSTVGAIELNLLTFMPLLDPVEKNRLKKIYVESDCRHLEQLISAYDFMRIIMSYEGLGEAAVSRYEAKKSELVKRHEKYSKKCALRPEICVYSRLVKDINHFLATCCHPKSLQALIDAATRVHTKFADPEQKLVQTDLTLSTEVIKRVDLWINNADRFESHTLSQYTTFYRDFTLPIETSLTTLKFGLTGLKHSLLKQRDSVTMKGAEVLRINSDDQISNVLIDLVEYPSVRGLQILPDAENCDGNIPLNDALERIENRQYAYFL